LAKPPGLSLFHSKSKIQNPLAAAAQQREHAESTENGGGCGLRALKE
jgi:hypothetical protein